MIRLNPPPLKEAVLQGNFLSKTWTLFFQRLHTETQKASGDTELQTAMNHQGRDFTSEIDFLLEQLALISGMRSAYESRINSLEMLFAMFVHPNSTWEQRINDLEAGEPFPIGSVFIAVVSTNPASLLGYGTWSAFGSGKFLVGIDAGDSDFDTAEETGGAKTHLHAVDVGATTSGTPSATAEVASGTGATVASGTHTHSTDPVSVDSATVSNVPPYIVVYMWKRTA